MEVYVGQESQVLDFQVFDQNNNGVKKADLKEITFRSSSPTVAVVNEAGGITALNTGSTNITITVKGSDDKTISKVVTLTVKAAPKATSLKVEPANVRLVIGTTLTQTVKVEILDQYGNTFKPATTKIEYTINNSKIAAGLDKDAPTPYQAVTTEAGKGTISLNAYSDGNNDVATASGTLKISAEGLDKSISIALVKAGSFAGYVAVADGTSLDVNGDAQNDNNVKGPKTVDVKVYEKDVNGNYLKEATNVKLSATKKEEFITVDNAAYKVTAAKAGTESVYVEVNNVRIATLNFTVVNSAKHLATVTQSNNGVTVKNGADLLTVLFGEVGKTDGGIFVGYDQYGTKFEIDRNNADVVRIISNKTNVVDDNGLVKGTGEAHLTVKIGDKFFSIVVKVVD